MRIVVLTTSFPRSVEDPSGHFVRSSAQRLCAAGHEVHVIAPGGAPWEPPREESGLIVHRAGGGALFAWPGAIARARAAPFRVLSAGAFAAGALSRLRRIGPLDQAIAHWIVPSAFPLLLGVRAPLSVVAHGADVRLLLRGPRVARERVIGALLGRDARFTFSAGALLSALAGELAGELAAALRRASRVEPPAIEVPDVAARAAAIRAGLSLAPFERALVTVCRLIPTKRVELALVAARELAGVGRLWVIGDGPEQAFLSRRAAELGAKVTFLGALPRREALAWMAAADVLLHPSAVEAAPTVIREARALGLPVVACDAGDVVAWARDDAGIQVIEPSAGALAEAIRGLPLRR
jgi:teichuronic acid biosynthesis glycosyltransferase TuaC